MSELAIIGGSGLARWPELREGERKRLDTPFGPPSEPPVQLSDGREAVWFLPRHGETHRLPPHAINYRANLWALHQLGVREILAVNTVGGIDAQMGPGQLVVPDQLIDYTWGRAHSFEQGEGESVAHIDFTEPFGGSLRQRLLNVLANSELPHSTSGTYGCTQGPRLETAAEIGRLRRDGCHLVGMTAMPEAALARELGMDYAAICLVVNWAAGIGAEALSLTAIQEAQRRGAEQLKPVLAQVAGLTHR